jgi:hypothetical protein
VAHFKVLLDDGETRLKCNLTALDHYEEKLAQFQEAIQKMHTLEATFRINAMLEAPLQSVEDNLDKIIRTNFRAAAISYRQLSGFTRVPGYPKPTMRMIKLMFLEEVNGCCFAGCVSGNFGWRQGKCY